MKAVILIVENRIAYRDRLLSGLQHSESNYECLAVSDIQQVNNLKKDTFNRITLILTAELFSTRLASIFPGVLRLELTDKIPDECSTNILGELSDKLRKDSAEKLHLHLPEITKQGHCYLSRQSPVSFIRELISVVLTKPLAANSDHPREIKSEKITKTAIKKKTSQDSYSLGCLLFFTRSERIKACTSILKSGKRKAHDMIYLPLMPLYDMAFPFRTGSRQTLGDLLLKLKSGRIPKHEDLGNYLYLHNDGYYTFSCPGRADDLICADSRSLRELIILLRKYLETRAAPTHSLIEVSGLTLERHAMVAALCDYVVIETPNKTTDAALMAQQELAVFLSKLPSSCEIYENSRIAKLSEEAPWFY